jgi:hypothetical protein
VNHSNHLRLALYTLRFTFTKESIIEKRYLLKISPNPSLPSGPEALWAGGQRGEFLPFLKGGEGMSSNSSELEDIPWKRKGKDGDGCEILAFYLGMSLL